MHRNRFVTEEKLGKLAKQFRIRAKKTRAEAAREMGVSQVSIFNAEEKSTQSLSKLRVRMIEAYSSFIVRGPVFILKSKGD